MTSRSLLAEARRRIHAPPEKLYEILADYKEHHPRILPPETFRGLVVEKGGRGDGTELRVVMRVGGRDRTIHLVVSEPEPGRVLMERDRETGAVTTFTVEREGDGADVRIKTEWPARRGLRGWVERLVAPAALRALYAKELARLEEYAGKAD
jgi:uncharacterized protein YndB with AHSA1/START domain